MAIETKLYGPNHPEVAKYFRHLGEALKGQVRTYVSDKVWVVNIHITLSMVAEAEQRTYRVMPNKLNDSFGHARV